MDKDTTKSYFESYSAYRDTEYFFMRTYIESGKKEHLAKSREAKRKADDLYENILNF